MKTKYFILVLASCLATLFTSCSESWPYSEEAYDNVWIEVYPSHISLDEDEFSGDFNIRSSDSWHIYGYPSWINISNNYGYSGYNNVTFTVDENDGDSIRYGYIKIRTNGKFTKEAEIIEIAQSPTTSFEATMYTTNYKAAGDYWYLYVNAASSKSWNISKSASWVHLGNSSNSSYSYSGTGDAMVKIYVDSNPYSHQRSSALTVTCGSKSKTITITQDGK